MTALPRRRRNRSLIMLATTLVVAASVPVLGYVGVKAVLDSTGGTRRAGRQPAGAELSRRPRRRCS